MSLQHPVLSAEPVDDDLRALAEEIASTTGAPAATALQLASAIRPGLREYIGRWNAAVRRARAAAGTHKSRRSGH